MSTETSGSATAETSRLRMQFELMESGLNGLRETPFHTMRTAALDQFEALGFPTRKHEDWKYVNVRHLAERGLKPALYREAASALPFSDDQATRLVFVNGHYSEAQSVIHPEDGIEVGSLYNAMKQHAQTLQPHFGQLTADDSMAFSALNTAFFQDGVCVVAKKGKQAIRQIIVEARFASLEESEMVFPRNLILAEDGAAVKVVHIATSEDGGKICANAVTEIVAGRDASVRWVEIQDPLGGQKFEYVHTLCARTDAGGSVQCYTMSTGGELVRNDLRVHLAGSNSTTDLRGLYLPLENDVVDNHLRIDHAVPDCESNQLYKGIADGTGKGVFNGQIHVWEDAQRTNAYQTNKNVVLSDTASINTKPQLEIYADDVRCSHGATSGQLNREAIYYLQARGIPEAAARSLLLNAFAADVLEGIEEGPLRTYLIERLENKLATH